MTPWEKVNRALVAKAIGELLFEEVLSAQDCGEGRFRLELASGVHYHFHAEFGAWGHLWVAPESLLRSPGSEVRAAQFFRDSLTETQMSEVTLGTFLEELQSTLHADLQLASHPALSRTALLTLSPLEREQRLPGHPKLLLNKGRLGWGLSDLRSYAPEYGARFQLRWVLVQRSETKGLAREDFDRKAVVATSFHGAERSALEAQLKAYPDDLWELMPVHPWQWDRIVSLQFHEFIVKGVLVDLGLRGDLYAPQTSLRTLSNLTRPHEADIKLPLSILNTSCVRGLPQRYLEATPIFAEELQALCLQDPELSSVRALREHKTLGVRHPDFHALKQVAYRYQESLGAIWRQSTASLVQTDEEILVTAALLETAKNGQTLLSALAEQAQLTTQEWLEEYTRAIIVPLYHLQLNYGVGVVAHGQNIVLRMHQGVPVGLVLKDYHGDVRLSNEHQAMHQRYFPGSHDRLPQLPPEHLIHDLITGHFITMLRFLSRRLALSGAIEEKIFYHTIAQGLADYHARHPELASDRVNLLAPSFQRVLVNKVRFHIGYGDGAARPLPLLGSDLPNPLREGAL